MNIHPNTGILLPALACLAVGDALGHKFEFFRNLAASDVQEHIDSDRAVNITDDSQMTYFGMRAMRLGMPCSVAPRKIILDQYRQWYRTQTTSYLDCRRDYLDDVPAEMYRVMAPGKACMQSMYELSAADTRSINSSRGCGSVMRLLPFVVAGLDQREALSLALLSARITHDHPENVHAVSLYVTVAYECASGALVSVPEAVVQARCISDLGAGFYALECVHMAIWAVSNSATLNDVLLQSIAHDGDSDSVAAVAGSLWGLLHKEMPPVRLLNRIGEWQCLSREAFATLLPT